MHKDSYLGKQCSPDDKNTVPAPSAGKPMAELISELVWQPMGAKEDADFTLDNFRTPIFNGGMCATLQGRQCSLSSWAMSGLHLPNVAGQHVQAFR